ncbi:MAG: 1-acyl-sn-glycerol-3-phosphate acyltransferase [Chitinispirillaceae bacterium]|nr:1-acyl-sn-glycerol-3-phosphate acyltransferase [Chitinispirillaceae bacterium]
MRTLFVFLRGIFCYLIFGLIAIITILLSILICILFRWNKKLAQKIIKKIFNFFCFFFTRKFLPAFNIYKIIEESGFELINPNMPAVFVANHRSRIDGLLLISKLPDTAVLIKDSYINLPFCKTVAEGVDFIGVKVGSLDVLIPLLDRCKKHLSEGKRILIFPEGTRATNRKLNPFREFAFRLAKETDTPVIPIVIHTDLPFMTKIKGSYFPLKRMNLRIKVLEPIYAEKEERPSRFASRVKKIIEEQLYSMDKGSVWENL